MMQTKIKSLSNTWHFYAILVALIGLSFVSLWYLIILGLYLIYLYRIRFINKYLIILMIYFIVMILFLSLYCFLPDKKEITGIVISVSKHDDYYSLVIISGLKKIRVVTSTSNVPQIGDKILASGTFRSLGVDDYSLYLKGSGIFEAFSARSIEIKGRSIFSIKGNIINFYDKHLDDKSYMYFKSLILGINDFDLEYKEAINSIGISYLFCISGFHISIIVKIFDKILTKFFPLSYKRDYILIIILFIYAAMTNFSYGVLRAFLMYSIAKMNSYKHLGMSKLDICSLSFLLITIINPMSLYSMSLRLSYIIMLMIILSEGLLKDKSSIEKSYLMALISFIVTVPMIISMNHEINLITLIISPIFLALFSIIILPLTYLLIIMPFIYPLVSSIYFWFEKLIYLFNSIEFFKLTVREFRAYEVIIYYTIYYFSLRHFENNGLSYFKLLGMLLVIFAFNSLNQFVIYDQIVMLDVGQGDSILLKCRQNKGNLLIDSYNNLDNLKSLGIKEIDTLIITHSDDDHYETAKDVISKYNVKTVITSYYDDTANNDIDALDVKHIKASKGDKYNFNGITIDFLAPYDKSSSLNNNSLVFLMNVNQTKILFTGDMEKEEEQGLIDNKLTFDILKVPHHGSSSSLSDDFYNNLKYKEAIISVGANNKYGHPNEEIIAKLSSHKYYRTDIDGQIYINIYKRNYKIKINLDYNFLQILHKVL